MKKRFISGLVIIAIGVIIIMVMGGCSNPQVIDAKVYISQNNYEQAVEKLLLAVEQNPQDSEAWFLLGDVYGMQEKYREMNEAFNKSLEADVKFADKIDNQRSYYWQELFRNGVNLIKNDKMELAADQFQLAIELAPNQTDAYKNLAYIYSNMGQDSLALEVYNNAIAIDSADLELKLAKGMIYYRMKKYEKTIQQMDKVLELTEPGSATYKDALIHKAFALDLLGKKEEAIATYESALAIMPEDKDLIFNLGRLYYIQDDYENAVKYFKQVVDLNPDDFDATTNIGNAYLQMEKWEEAVPFLEKAVELNPESAAAWNNLGIAYVRSGDVEKGKAAFDKAEELQ